MSAQAGLRTDLLGQYSGRKNSLNAIRLALASLVVVSHSWQLGGYGEQPSAGNTYAATWGLYGFFAISGFLILRSRLARPSAVEFYWARLLRIVPGFVVCLLVVAFVIAPLSQIFEPGGYSLRDAVQYVIRNLLLYPPFLHQAGIGSTLSTVPFAGNWDEPMWSLFYEFACYALVGTLVTVLPRRTLAAVVPALFVVATAATFCSVRGVIGLPYEYAIGLTLVTPFLAGSVLCVLGDRIPVRRWDLVVSGAALAVVVWTGTSAIFAALPLAHVLLRLGQVLPFTSVGRRWDVSFGVYIYGLPVQQLVVLAFPHQALPLPIYVTVVFALLLPLAWVSSALIEMPALRLKARVPRLASAAGPRALPAANHAPLA